MIIKYSKTYSYEVERTHYKVTGIPTFKNTNVFHEYYDLIMKCPDVNKLGLIEMIKTFKPQSKAKIKICYNKNGIEFLKPNKYIFPEFYIKFTESLEELRSKSGHSLNYLIEDEAGQFDFVTRGHGRPWNIKFKSSE